MQILLHKFLKFSCYLIIKYKLKYNFFKKKEFLNVECVFINFKIELIYLDMFDNIIDEYAQNMAKAYKI